MIVSCLLTLMCACELGSDPYRDGYLQGYTHPPINDPNAEEIPAAEEISTDTDSTARDDIEVAISSADETATYETETEATDETPSLVTQGLSSLVIPMTENSVMDPVAYFGNNVSFEMVWSFNGAPMYDIKGDKSAYDMAQAYVELLCSEYNFTLAAEPYLVENDYGARVLSEFEFVLLYTGDVSMKQGEEGDGKFTGIKGHVCLCGNIEDVRDGESTLKMDIEIDASLDLADHGYRYGEEHIPKEYVGASFGAGLYRYSDGRYETADGRLSAVQGQAMILSDGVPTIRNVRVELSENAKKQSFIVENQLGLPLVQFSLPATRVLASGMTFAEQEFFAAPIFDLDVPKSFESINSNFGFNILHGETYLVPLQGMFTDLKTLAMRVMYVDPEYTEAVIYFCATLRTAPKTVEGLLVVNMNGLAEGGSSSSGTAQNTYRIRAGESIDIEGPNQFGSMYHVYSWSYISGSDISEMRNTNQYKVTVIGHKLGTVRIKLRYEYTERKNDMVTGREEDNPTYRICEYVIHISD